MLTIFFSGSINGPVSALETQCPNVYRIAQLKHGLLSAHYARVNNEIQLQLHIRRNPRTWEGYEDIALLNFLHTQQLLGE
ncbi:hypothetical protein FRX31_013998 [Thalictrum thalictroides]|uniref:Uncharacterized protein n=1 Tax=Thalictrum thalictroides TaxID=46969 RepID=A0A7J6WJ01_THATH|nr:hypothetical protein FRX31_013998 [Thalictrum thalictroides]